jgi:hypothetical protein
VGPLLKFRGLWIHRPPIEQIPRPGGPDGFTGNCSAPESERRKSCHPGANARLQNQQSPINNAPINNRQSAMHQSTIANQQCTNQQSPISNAQSTIANQQSTNRQSRNPQSRNPQSAIGNQQFVYCLIEPGCVPAMNASEIDPVAPPSVA